MNETERLAKELLGQIQAEQMTHSAQEAPKARERGRAIAQGLTFGGADEAEAWARSALGGEDYDTALADVRSKLEAYRGDRPWEALGYEAGGAALPAILGAVFTGGGSTASLFPTLAKVAASGAAEGGAYAFLSGEGGAGERLKRVPEGAIAGGIAAPVGYAATKGIGATLKGVSDFARRKLGPRASTVVERELRKVLADSDMTVDEAIESIARGDLLAEGNKTLRSVARAYYAQSREAAKTFEDVYTKRPGVLRKETMDYLQAGLAGQGDDNVLRRVTGDIAAQKAEKSAAYNQVFSSAGGVSDDVVESLKGAILRSPEAADDAAKLYRAQTGKTPFWVVKNGSVKFNKRPTLEDAEIIRRGLKDRASSLYRSGSGSVASAVQDVEKGVRSALDEFSPELGNVRQEWSVIEGARDAFDLGRSALARSPDEVALQFDDVSRKGEAALKAYRAGVMDAYRRKAATGSKASMPRLIADEGRKEGAILRIVFPQDDLGTLVSKAERGARAQEAANQILGGSQTAITQGRISQTGANLATDMTEAAMGSHFAMVRLAGQALKSVRPSLSPQDIGELAKLMVAENPDVLRRAMTDTTAIDAVHQLAAGFADRATKAASYGSAPAAVGAAESLGVLGLLSE